MHPVVILPLNERLVIIVATLIVSLQCPDVIHFILRVHNLCSQFVRPRHQCSHLIRLQLVHDLPSHDHFLLFGWLMKEFLGVNLELPYQAYPVSQLPLFPLFFIHWFLIFNFDHIIFIIMHDRFTIIFRFLSFLSFSSLFLRFFIVKGIFIIRGLLVYNVFLATFIHYILS